MWAALALVAFVLGLALLTRACAPAKPAAASTPRPAPRSTGSPAAADAARAPLAAGACQALGPTGRDRRVTVFVDPGHGGPDPGVLGRTRSGTTVRESAAALAVGQELARQLRADGYRVVLSRTRDTSVERFDPEELAGGGLSSDQVRDDLERRVGCADSAGAAVLLSIHFNGYRDSSVSGTQTIYDDARPFAGESERLARSLQSALVSRLRLADRGVVTDDQLGAPALSEAADAYGHLLLLGPAQPGWLKQATTMPGALVEPLFLTAPDEAAVAASSTGQKRIAAALAAGIEGYLAPAS